MVALMLASSLVVPVWFNLVDFNSIKMNLDAQEGDVKLSSVNCGFSNKSLNFFIPHRCREGSKWSSTHYKIELLWVS